jgi:hypothetical protein
MIQGATSDFHGNDNGSVQANRFPGQSGGNSYTFAEIKGSLEQAGFKEVRLIHPDTRIDGLVEAFKRA